MLPADQASQRRWLLWADTYYHDEYLVIEGYGMISFMPGPPPRPPVGLQLTRASRLVSRAFDDALSAAGGSLPVWLVLISLKTQQLGSQRQLAGSVGVQEATLSHHLNAMVDQGLLTRERDPANRRVHQVRLTEAGEAVFVQLRSAAFEFDQRLRIGISDSQVATFERLLGRFVDNVAPPGGQLTQVGDNPDADRPVARGGRR